VAVGGPDRHPRLDVYYAVHDQYLGVNADFPVGDDPSPWAVLELVK